MDSILQLVDLWIGSSYYVETQSMVSVWYYLL